MLLNKWQMIAEKHYVDYSAELSTDEIAHMLEERAKRVEMPYEEYEFRYLPRIREVAEGLVQRGTCANLGQGYRYQARYNLHLDDQPAGAYDYEGA